MTVKEKKKKRWGKGFESAGGKRNISGRCQNYQGDLGGVPTTERKRNDKKKGCHQSPIEQCFNHFQLGLTLLNICSPFSVK